MPYQTELEPTVPTRTWRNSYRLPRHSMLATTLVLVTSVVIYPIIPRLYTGSADFVVRSSTPEGTPSWEQSVRAQLDDNAIQTKLDVLRSAHLQKKVIDELRLIDDPEFNRQLHPSLIRQFINDHEWVRPWLPNEASSEADVNRTLTRHLTVKREGKSYLVHVGYWSEDPQKAARLTNSLVNSYVATEFARAQHEHSVILDALANRVQSLDGVYQRDEAAEHDFVVASGLIHSGDKVSLQEQLRSLSSDVAGQHRKVVETASRGAMLSALRGEGVDNTSDALASPLLQRLRERYVELTSGSGTGNVPSGMITSLGNNLQQGIETESRRLVQAAQNDLVVASRAEASLREEIARLDDKLVKWSENERHRDELHRLVQSDLDALSLARQRYGQEVGRGDTLLPDVYAVSISDVPDRPFFPDPVLYSLSTISLLLLINALFFLPKIRILIRGL